MEKTQWFAAILGEDSPARRILERKIEYMADDLCRRHVAGLGADDREDIVQELWSSLCVCGDRYDPERGAITTYCYQRLLSASNLIVRKRLAETRLANLRTLPIAADRDEAARTHGVTEDALGAAPEGSPYNAAELRSFAERQPEPVRSLLLRYMDGDLDSVAAMAREAGLPKTSFVRKHLEPCRRRFADEFGELG